MDTVAFNLDKPFADFPYLVSSGDYNSVILPRNFAGDFVTNPVGTGPFMLGRYKTSQRDTLKNNPNYWQKGLPYLDGMHSSTTTTATPGAPGGVGRR